MVIRSCSYTSVVVITLSLLCGCTVPFHERSFSGAETVEMKVESTINGMKRTARLHIPKGYSKERSYPLVVVIHGAFSTAEKMELETGFSTLADREGVVVLYPEGMGIFGLLQHWNAGHCCGKAVDDNLDDVAYLEECIDKATEGVSLDRTRIYITGFSNGGMMAHRFAAEKSEIVAAFAALGASVGGRADSSESFWLPVRPAFPVPAMIVHGMADTAVPPGGGASSKKKGTREYLSLESSTEFWLRANGCRDEFTERKSHDERVVVRNWSKCLAGSRVVLYRLAGWKHLWPGYYFTQHDTSLSSFDVTELIWSFFQPYSR